LFEEAVMNERTWERYGAGSGIVFFVLLLASVIVAPLPPSVTASASEITSYFNDNRASVLLSGILGSLAAMALLWFVGHLRHVLQRAEGGAEKFSPMVYGTGLMIATLGLLGALPGTMLAFMADQSGATGNAPLMIALNDATQIIFAMLAIPAALFLGTAGWAMVRGELARPWLGWLGMVIGVISLAGGIAGFYATSASQLALVGAFAGGIGLGLWVAIAGGVMLYQPEVERAAAGRAIFAH
jgi:hypothetical protein